MREYSKVELANAQNYLMMKGHACPSIVGDEVHYLDRTRGHHRVVRTIKIDAILEEIRGLRVVPIEKYTDKSSFTAGSVRYAIGQYQAMEYQNKLLYIEDLSIELKGLFDGD